MIDLFSLNIHEISSSNPTRNFFFSSGAVYEKDAAQKRGAIYSSMSSVLAKIHSIDFNVEELRDYGKTDGKYLRRNLARWAGQVKTG